MTERDYAIRSFKEVTLNAARVDYQNKCQKYELNEEYV